MYKHIFELIDGVALFPVLALLIFFTFFMLVIMWLVRMDRGHVRYMEEMPLDHPVTSPNNGGKSMAKVEDKLFDHDYDGIREYDNPLPPWWVNLFFITIVWGIVYVLYYHVFEIGDRSVDEFKKEYDQTWIKEKDPDYVAAEILPGYRNPYYSNRPEITPKSMLSGVVIKPKEEEKEIVYDFTPLTDQPALQKGLEVWVKNCVVCHGQKGEGGIGPNLTDDYWIHGNGINNVMKTIIKGVPEKGMLAWGKILKQEEMLQVGSYVLTLHGTNPPNAKAPQGTLAK